APRACLCARILPPALPARGVRDMTAVRAPLFGAAGRRRRRTLLLTLAALAVSTYILAPFCWLLLTSFMHEQEALSVPPQWIPHHPTPCNYENFFPPSGAPARLGRPAPRGH